MEHKKRGYIWVALYLLLLFCTGGAYKQSTYWILWISFCFCAVCMRRRGFLRIPRTMLSLESGLMGISVFLTLFNGVDRGESVYGLIRYAVICAVCIAFGQWTSEQRENALQSIPYLGITVTVLGCLFRYLPVGKSWISAVGRLSGPFEYPNTMALFLLLGLVVSSQAKDRYRWIIHTILCTGIFLTGSRTVFLAMCGYFLWGIFRKGKRYVLYILIPLSLMAAGLLLQKMKAPVPGFYRFLTLGLESSTFQGRLLYWEDALAMLAEYPMGLGYMGYFYMQQLMQTGVYSVRFVHNEWLQFGLDYGILAGAGAAVLFSKLLFQTHLAAWKREFLLIVGFCSFFDFHLQYWSILLPVLLLQSDMVPYQEWKRGKIQKGILFAGIAFSAVILVSTSIAQVYAEKGDYDAAVRWNPLSTDYRVAQMLRAPDLSAGEDCARSVLEGNPMVYAALKVRSNGEAQRTEVEQFIESRKKVIALRKYEAEEYEEYFAILYDLYLEAVAQNREQERKACIRAMKEIPEIILKVKRETSLRAYRIQDKPELYFPEQYVWIIDNLNE